MSQILSAVRRHSAKFFVVAIFLLPTLLGLQKKNEQTTENRNLAAWPALPNDWKTALKFPSQIDLWINDHMAYREDLIALNNSIRFHVFGQFPTVQMVKGKHGRIFLAAHNMRDEPNTAIFYTCGYTFKTPDSLQFQINHFTERHQAYGIAAKLMIAPSAPVVYNEDLPNWQAKRCRSAPLPIDLALKSDKVKPEAKANTFYPLPQFLAVKNTQAIFPKTWFHWAGDGTRLAAELSVKQFWQIEPAQYSPLKITEPTLPSDVSHLFPGVTLESKVPLVDFAASGISECRVAKCFPGITDVMDKMWGIALYTNPKAKNEKLVLISDSFGLSLGPWYSRYYKNVVQVATNALERLTPEETKRLREYLYDKKDSTHFLYVYHDGTMQNGRVEADLKALLP